MAPASVEAQSHFEEDGVNKITVPSAKWRRNMCILDVCPRLGSLRSRPRGGVQCTRGLLGSALGIDSCGQEAEWAEGRAGLG